MIAGAALCVLTAAGCAETVDDGASAGSPSAPAAATTAAPTGTPTAAPTGTPTGAPAEPTGATGGGLTNDKGEKLDERVVRAVNEANPKDPDAYRALPGTTYSGAADVYMVIDSSSTAGGHLKFRIREVSKPGTGAGEGLGPWWSARADNAEFLTINGGAYPLEKFVEAQPTYPKGQEYRITFDRNLTIVKIHQV